MHYFAAVLALIVSAIHLGGMLSAAHAIWNCRTPQGAIAWSLMLTLFPYLGLPAYWSIGRDKFNGYVNRFRFGRLPGKAMPDYVEEFSRFWAHPEPRLAHLQLGYETLAHFPFTHSNHAELLIDGEVFFKSMFEGIDAAERFVLIEFYIIDDDQIGREFKQCLVRAASRGVRVYLVYDELGSWTLPDSYIRDLTDAGIEVHAFRPTRTWANRLQFNFRNHRKITVVDGRVAWVGGFNVQDDSLGRNKFYGPWRDTHVKLVGPAVHSLERSFLEDYYWASDGQLPVDINAPAQAAPGITGQGMSAVYVSTGPADEVDTGVLFFTHSINSARHRCWLASPYFIPVASVMDALKMAALRGVDVRVIIPLRWDLLVMYLAAFAYIPECAACGVRFYRYEPGHPHQKVMLIDDEVSWVGSANVDPRSMQLNFEGNLVVISEEFGTEMREMLEKDMAVSRPVGVEDYQRRSRLFKLGVKLARLFEPML